MNPPARVADGDASLTEMFVACGRGVHVYTLRGFSVSARAEHGTARARSVLSRLIEAKSKHEAAL